MAFDESILMAITVGVMGALGLTYLYNKHENKHEKKPQTAGSRRRSSRKSRSKSRKYRK